MLVTPHACAENSIKTHQYLEFSFCSWGLLTALALHSPDTMTSAHLDMAPPAAAAVSLIQQLSEKTKVTAHPGDKWKAGYLTFSRVSVGKSGWRNVHVSKRSFEKLGEQLVPFKDALKKKAQHHVMLNKKQHLLTTQFKREGKETLHYVSLMHPLEEKETLKTDDAINHAKTINLSSEEFHKFATLYQKLAQVVNSKSATGENDEGAQIEGFRWTFKTTGERSARVFLSRDHCDKEARMHFFEVNEYRGHPDDYDHADAYEYLPVQVERPSKLELIEHLAYATLVHALRTKYNRAFDGPPAEKDLNDVIERFDNVTFRVLVRKVMMKLSYKNLYLSGELVNMFLYFQGIEKVKNCLLKHQVSCSGKLFTRLLDHCFDIVNEEMNKE